MSAHPDCSEATIDEISRQLVDSSHDVAMADGAGSDAAAAPVARSTVEALFATGLQPPSLGNVQRAVLALMAGELPALLRDGQG